MSVRLSSDTSTSRPRQSLEERFWNKVDRRGPEECWPWLGARIPKGYGVISRGGRAGGNVYAHRLAYELAGGSVPFGHQIHHLCGNTSCVNPTHLRALDVEDHNRAHGTLNAEAVHVIRQSEFPGALLARAFGVDPSVISRIRSGDSWS